MKCILSLATSVLICLFCVGPVLSQTPPVTQEQLIAQQRLLADRFFQVGRAVLRMSEFESATKPFARGALAAGCEAQQRTSDGAAHGIGFGTTDQEAVQPSNRRTASGDREPPAIARTSAKRESAGSIARQTTASGGVDSQHTETTTRQQSLRGRTENGQDAKEASQDQAALEKQVQQLLEAMAMIRRRRGSLSHRSSLPKKIRLVKIPKQANPSRANLSRENLSRENLSKAN